MASFALEKDQPVNNDEPIVPATAEKKVLDNNRFVDCNANMN